MQLIRRQCTTCVSRRATRDPALKCFAFGEASALLQGTEPRQPQPWAAQSVSASRRDVLAAALLLASTCTGVWRPWPAQVRALIFRRPCHAATL